MHYKRWLRNGDPESVQYIQGDDEARFWTKVNKSSGSCWLWVGGISRYGYGEFWHNGGNYRAHRFSYELLVGPIPEGLQIDHLCRVRNCVNPARLEASHGSGKHAS